MNKTYILFSSFKRDIFTLVFPDGMAEQRVPLFRNFVVNGLIQLTTFCDSYQLFNVGFYDKDQSFDDCGTSMIQACRGQIGAVYAFKPSCRCERYFYDSASLEKLSCLYDNCKCATTGCGSNPSFSLGNSSYTRDPYYCGAYVEGNEGCLPPYLAAQPEDDCVFKSSSRYFAIGPGNRMWLYPRFPCGYVVAVHWRGIPRSYLDTDYILDDQDLKDAVATYVESEVARRVDKDQASADRLLLDYRQKAGDIIYREERDLKPRATRTCVEGIDRSELVQMYPSNPYPVYVGDQCAQKKTELTDIIEGSENPLVPIYPTTGCRDTFTFSWPLDDAFEDGTDVIQTSDSQLGPWYDYIDVVPDVDEIVAGTVTVEINNSFNGERWFRLVRSGVVFRGPALPQAAQVEMPSNIAVSNTTASQFGLHMTGPFVRPVSSQENYLINPTAVYVEPVGRREYYKDIDWDGLPTTVTLTAPAGATAKWTRDGTDPSVELTWPPPVYEGSSYNARVYLPDFAMGILARCFNGECRSPLAILLVDIRHNTLEMTKTLGNTISVYSNCDLPKEVNGVEYESGFSCFLYYGGSVQFGLSLEQYACSSMTGPAGFSGATKRTIFRYNIATGTAVSWFNWPSFEYNTSKFIMYDLVSSGYRDAGYWNAAPLVYEYAITNYGGGPSSFFKQIIAGPDQSGDALAGSGGVITDHAHAVAGYLVPFVPVCIGAANESALLENFEVLRSLQNDNAFFNTPQPPIIPVPPGPQIDGDDMESYLDSSNIELLVLNGGTGWDSAWTIIAMAILIGEDDMQFYADGSITDTVDADPFTDPVYNAGGGWSGAWRFSTDDRNVIGGDDFQSYSDGTVILGNLGNGSRWDTTDAFWWVRPGMEIGYDYFEEYSDGAITDTSLNLGVGWIGEGWKIN